MSSTAVSEYDDRMGLGGLKGVRGKVGHMDIAFIFLHYDYLQITGIE